MRSRLYADHKNVECEGFDLFENKIVYINYKYDVLT